MKISKSDYIRYLECKKNAWLKIHNPKIFNTQPLSDFEKELMNTGNEVDVLARDYFPTGVLCKNIEHTKELIEKGVEVLYQPIFETEMYRVICDILIRKDQYYDIYEVKASTTQGVEKSKKKLEQYTHDVGFQRQVLLKNNIPVGNTYLLLVNNDYVLRRSLQAHLFFNPMLIDIIPEDLERSMEKIYTYLSRTEEPTGHCCCLLKTRKNHCLTAWYSNPEVPKYSIHDITRISKKKICSLVESDVLDINDVPSYFNLTNIQRTQVECAKGKCESVDKESIQTFLENIEYPISFLDYETCPLAVPLFEGYHPYAQIPFQFSLHILTKEGLLTHYEFLHTTQDNPDIPFTKALFAHLPVSGSIVVWSQQFELGRNRDIVQRNQVYADIMREVEQRVVDLIIPFKKLYWVHPEFKGKTSIKFILPALVPEITYKNLVVQDGGMAAQLWKALVIDGSPTHSAKDLLDYCKQDTEAMVRIYKTLRNVIS